MKHYPLVRIALGVYLLLHFAMLLPVAPELFSAAGIAPGALSPFAGNLPNLLIWCDQPWLATTIVALGAALSFPLIIGKGDRFASIALLAIWATLFVRQPLISNPSIPFIGWMLLTHATLPRGEDGSLELPRAVWTLGWVVLAAGYTYSGLAKAGSPSWIDGSALYHILESPLARPTMLREWLVSQPNLLHWMTWSTLALEVLAVPLALFRKTRLSLWIALLGMHVGILLTVGFADLTFGMLVVHALVFDPAWIGRGRASRLSAKPAQC